MESGRRNAGEVPHAGIHAEAPGRRTPTVAGTVTDCVSPFSYWLPVRADLDDLAKLGSAQTERNPRRFEPMGQKIDGPARASPCSHFA
jgi:hypothetical protein